MRDFSLTRVVTRDMLRDSFQSIRNTFGLRLRGYESRINQTITEMTEEMRLRYDNIKWYRINNNPLTKGSIMITIYGVCDDD
jgi:uncharacterized protein YbjQ (UPF0145 family)